MTDPIELSMLAVFLTGLLGGVHCAGMCGGIVSAIGMMQKSVGKPVGIAVVAAGARSKQAATAGDTTSTVQSVALYNMGRIGTYTLLGAVAGAAGSLAWLMQSILPIQKTAYLISNLLLVLMGLYLYGFKRVALWIEGLGGQLWEYVQPAATRALRGSGSFNSIVTGSLWGLVPCGLVYASLGAALVSGSALRGALLMLVFGLGTLPNLMFLGLSGNWLARASKRLWVRRTAGIMILCFGLFGLMHLSMMGSS